MFTIEPVPGKVEVILLTPQFNDLVNSWKCDGMDTTATISRDMPGVDEMEEAWRRGGDRLGNSFRLVFN